MKQFLLMRQGKLEYTWDNALAKAKDQAKRKRLTKRTLEE